MDRVLNQRLSQRILPGQVAAGRFDGSHPCLACATPSGKVVVHHPHLTGAQEGWEHIQGDTSLLSIQKRVTGLAAAQLSKRGKEVLIIGTDTDLSVYDLVRNSDVFFRDMPDGASAVAFGRVGGNKHPWIFAGGSCSIQAFNADGGDEFWTVTGAHVLSLAVCDVNGDNQAEVVAGLDDAQIRVFTSSGELLAQLPQSDAVTSLCGLGGAAFAFALANGTVGVYRNLALAWKAKTKALAIALHGVGNMSDKGAGRGADHVAVAWSDGTLEVYQSTTGNVIFRDDFPAGLAGLAMSDYRLDGNVLLLAVSCEGEVRGYLPAGSALAFGPAPSIVAAVTADPEHERVLQELLQRKMDLSRELKRLRSDAVASPPPVAVVNVSSKAPLLPGESATKSATAGTLAPFLTHLELVGEELLLRVKISTGVVVMVTLFAEEMFPGESFVVHPRAEAANDALDAPLPQRSNQAVSVRVQVLHAPLVGATMLHCIETTVVVPPFAMCSVWTGERAGGGSSDETGSVVLPLPSSRAADLVRWFRANFLVPASSSSEVLDVRVWCTRSRSGVALSHSGDTLRVSTNNIELMADLVASILQTLNISEINSVLTAPAEMASLHELLVTVKNLQAVTQRLAAEMADKSALVKGLLFRAEDARLRGEIVAMRAAYLELYALNRDLISQYNIRCSNHLELLSCLKIVNQHIQRASRLRAGQSARNIISQCRLAIKSNDVAGLVRILCRGADPATVVHPQFQTVL